MKKILLIILLIILTSCLYSAYKKDFQIFNAINYRDIDLIKENLSNFDLNVTNNNGDTPLMLVTIKKDFPLVEFFLDNGADPNIQNKDGVTALIIAVKLGNYEIAKKLLDKKANINLRKRDDVSALEIAIDNEDKRLVDLLLEKKPDYTPLMLAILYNDDNKVKQLIKDGAKVNEKNIYGETPLIIAIRKKNYTITKYLLENGADVNILFKNNIALKYAIDTKSEEIIKILLMQNNFLEKLPAESFDYLMGSESGENYGQLLFPAINSNKLYLRLLKQNSRKINLQQINYIKNQYLVFLEQKVINTNPLFKAIYNQDSTNITYFMDLRRREKYYIDTNSGISALDIAALKSNSSLIGQIIDDKISLSDDFIFYVILFSNQEILKLLISKGINLNILDSYGHNAFYYAVVLEDIIKVKLLLATKPNINFRTGSLINNNSGETPLFIAISKGNYELTKLLVENGANINIKAFVDQDLIYPINLAVEVGMPNIINYLFTKGTIFNKEIAAATLYTAVARDNYEVAKILIEKGADPNYLYTDKQGEKFTLLKIAKSIGNKNMIELLGKYTR